MSDENRAVAEAEFQQLTGALALLVKLREELAGWTEEASDDCDGATLDRVLDHIQSLEAAYRNRKVLVQVKLQDR